MKPKLVKSPIPKALERWEIGALSELPATVLVTGPDDHAGKFILSLSLAFNDLKGLVMFERMLLLYPKPPGDEISAYVGQWGGLLLQIHRFIAGVLQETMNVIRTEGRPVIETAAFKALVDSLHERHRGAWNELVNVALTERVGAMPREGSFARTLYDIRNKAGFHYLGSELAPSYAKAFDPSATTLPVSKDGGRTAYYSAGENMEQTRFYYADRAVQQRLMDSSDAGTNGNADDVVVDHARKMNDALGVLVAAFIRSRASSAPPTT